MTAAVTSGRSQAPLAITANEHREPVGWALAHGRSWRFPFMQGDDLQIGLVFVEARYRKAGRGLSLVIDLVRGCEAGAGNLWWFCAESNAESVRIAQRAGFEQIGIVDKVGRVRGYRLKMAGPSK